MRPFVAQLRLELTLLARNGESLLLTLGIPMLLLVFFAKVDVLPIDGEPIDFLAPGVLALAVLSTAFVNLAISTGFDREYGVLKRLGATPLGRPRLLAAKTISILVVEVVQIAVLWLLALALGWDPSPDVGFVAAVVLGTVAFAGLGLCLAGSLKALVTLAAANGLYLVLLLLSGMVIPLDEMPAPARALARALPSGALAEAVRGTLAAAETVPTRAWLVLAAWAIAAPAAAIRLFRWE
ncbi:ABC transporter permease [Nitrosomonas communis]|uniref:ABC transporter permease n=1 Tax=Nitrosomonas communis TaxID=44574 RepID=UPI003D2D5B98